MYYLNDRHPKYEYALYKCVDKALPYIARTFDSMADVLRFVQELEKQHNHYRQTFYIDNDFYQNSYNIGTSRIYYKFLRRPVSDWEEFTGVEIFERVA